MSEPIQSIAQNNYILATQQEVSHDNSLSGNGTVESPLGLNETVLYESTTGFKYGDTNLQLSEPMSNFERIVFINGKGQGWSIYTSPITTDYIVLPYAYYTGNTTSNIENVTVVLRDGGTSFSFGSALSYQGNCDVAIASNGSVTRTNNINNATSRIYKVIGINRKQ